MLWFEYRIGLFESHGFVIVLIVQTAIVVYRWKYSKLFYVYKNKLVIKYPSVLFLNDHEIDFSETKRIIFKYGASKGFNTMTVVSEMEISKFKFSRLYGLDLFKVFSLLRSLGVELEIDKSFGYEKRKT